MWYNNMFKLILATTNQNKITEYRYLLKQFSIDVIVPSSDYPEVAETGNSFEENALIKAQFASDYYQCPAIADDSGLMIRCLNGRPGLLSARYSGKHGDYNQHIKKILAQMIDMPERQAFFVTALVFVDCIQSNKPLYSQGELQGEIALQQTQIGFGYEPIFYLPQYNCYYSELPMKEKYRISHRAQAINQLVPLLVSSR